MSYAEYKKVPMEEPLIASWGLALHPLDVTRLKAGFVSQDMDDKWDIIVEDPDEKNGISVHFMRSWTGREIYTLHLRETVIRNHENKEKKENKISRQSSKEDQQILASQIDPDNTEAVESGIVPASKTSSFCIDSITWEGDKNSIRIDDEQAKKEAVFLARCHLGCEFKTLPDYDASIFWTHPAYNIQKEDANQDESVKDEPAKEVPRGLFMHAHGLYRR